MTTKKFLKTNTSNFYNVDTRIWNITGNRASMTFPNYYFQCPPIHPNQTIHSLEPWSVPRDGSLLGKMFLLPGHRVTSRVPLHEEERLLGKITQTPGNLKWLWDTAPIRMGWLKSVKSKTKFGMTTGPIPRKPSACRRLENTGPRVCCMQPAILCCFHPNPSEELH